MRSVASILAVLSLAGFATLVAGCFVDAASGPDQAESVDVSTEGALREECPSPSVTATACIGDHICTCFEGSETFEMLVRGACPKECHEEGIVDARTRCIAAREVADQPGACGEGCESTGVTESSSKTTTCCTSTRTRGCRPRTTGEVVGEE